MFTCRMDVEKGKIEDTGGSGGSYSIKTQFYSEEQWTKALKFMLTNLKWGLAWASSRFHNKRLPFFLRVHLPSRVSILFCLQKKVLDLGATRQHMIIRPKEEKSTEATLF